MLRICKAPIERNAGMPEVAAALEHATGATLDRADSSDEFALLQKCGTTEEKRLETIRREVSHAQ